MPLYTVAHIVGIFLFYPNLWNYLKNNLFLIDLDNSIHSQILLNNNFAPQKGTNIAHQHGFDPGASQLRGHCFVTELWLYAAQRGLG